MHFHPSIYESTESCPISKIANTAINLMHDQAIGFALFQKFEYFIEKPASLFSRRLSLFKPLSYLPAFLVGTLKNCGSLLF